MLRRPSVVITAQREHLAAERSRRVDAVRVVGFDGYFEAERVRRVFREFLQAVVWLPVEVSPPALYGNGLPPVEGVEVSGLGGHGGHRSTGQARRHRAQSHNRLG
jgi:hypothetical protein